MARARADQGSAITDQGTKGSARADQCSARVVSC